MYKDLLRRIAPDNVLPDMAFVIASNLQYNGYQRVFASMVYNFFVIKSKDTTTNIGIGIIFEKQQLSKDFQKYITTKFKKQIEYLSYLDSICGADLVNCN